MIKIKLQVISKYFYLKLRKMLKIGIKKKKGLYIIKESAIIFESKNRITFDKIIFVKSSQKQDLIE